uniref:26S proteasome non-ATPase regulatory subunit 4 n=1 Tax=Takifugu rubripes TaxID=31033 RepID=H2RXI6_TAKRU
MVLESTVVCVDNSEYMRNGDFLPTRLQAQQDAVNIVCHSKTRSNPENNVGLITMANNCEVLTTLTPDTARILSKLHAVQPCGNISFCTGIRVAHLALKHRQGKNHKMRIIVFVGSPVEDNEKELIKMAKRLKKEKVNVDVINFGEEEMNTEKLTAFINCLNGKEGTGSHLITVPPGPSLADALLSSPILAGEGGAALGLGSSDFDFGVDPSADPELALALRVSMEEQRQRQEEEARRTTVASAADAGVSSTVVDESPDTLLKMSVPHTDSTTPALPDFSRMTEDEQIAYALQMSMQGEGDPEFLQSVLENLPGVDPNNDAIRNAMGSLASQTGNKPESQKKDEKKK